MRPYNIFRKVSEMVVGGRYVNRQNGTVSPHFLFGREFIWGSKGALARTTLQFGRIE